MKSQTSPTKRVVRWLLVFYSSLPQHGLGPERMTKVVITTLNLWQRDDDYAPGLITAVITRLFLVGSTVAIHQQQRCHASTPASTSWGRNDKAREGRQGAGQGGKRVSICGGKKVSRVVGRYLHMEGGRNLLIKFYMCQSDVNPLSTTERQRYDPWIWWPCLSRRPHHGHGSNRR